MESTDFIQSANLLIKGPKEIDYRNAISRAYYGAFHACCNLAEKNQLVSLGGSHEKLVDALKLEPKFKTIGNQLHDAKIKRRIADYHLNRKITQSEAKNIVRKCVMIQGEVHSLLEPKAS
jgi:uncharacterized protein (UPF0332 family)